MTEKKHTLVFTGKVKFPIKGQEKRNKWEQEAFKVAIQKGMGASQQLRYVCRIATDANEVFDILETTEGIFTLNPKGKAQFGRNHQGHAYLTVGLVGEDGERYRLHWEGDAVPRKMKEVAVKHDEGRKVAPCTVILDLGLAKVWRLGAKAGVKRESARKRNDVDKNGKPYKRPARRNHDRLCSADLEAGA